MIEKKEILDAFSFRHACKIFDESKKIERDDLEFILQTARLSPSSFGMEPWRFVVITDQALKKALRPHCWDQAQITTCSHLVVVLSKTAAVSDDSYIESMFARRGLKKEDTLGYIEKLKGYIKEKVMGFAVRYLYKKSLKNRAIYEWCSRQCYIATANMATSAAMIGIDSCFIEGFKKEEVEKVLGLDTTKEEVSVLLPLGYRLKEQPQRFRLSMDELVETRD